MTDGFQRSCPMAAGFDTDYDLVDSGRGDAVDYMAGRENGVQVFQT